MIFEIFQAGYLNCAQVTEKSYLTNILNPLISAAASSNKAQLLRADWSHANGLKFNTALYWSIGLDF